VKRLFSDTDPRAEAILIAGIRRMTGAERLARVAALRESALGLARVRIRERHGEISEREVRLRLASLWLDRKTMVEVFDWDPAEKGF
jgi:hypothetical protein